MTAVAVDQVRGIKIRQPSDSRRRMDFLAKISKALGLEDADEEKVLEALTGRVALADVVSALELDDADDVTDNDKLVEAVKAKFAADKGEEKSLEDRAKEEGKEVVSKARLDTLEEKAEKGVKAEAELHQAKFDTAYDKALEGLRVDAKDETRERYEKLYKADAETTLETLEKLPKLAPTEARGKTGKPGDAAPEGVDAERHELDQKVKAYVKEHPDKSYVEALEIVEAELEEATA